MGETESPTKNYVGGVADSTDNSHAQRRTISNGQKYNVEFIFTNHLKLHTNIGGG